MKKAKCYYARGWWRYYRTEDGYTFSSKNGNSFFYHGNVFDGEKKTIYISSSKDLDELHSKIEFVN